MHPFPTEKGNEQSIFSQAMENIKLFLTTCWSFWFKGCLHIKSYKDKKRYKKKKVCFPISAFTIMLHDCYLTIYREKKLSLNKNLVAKCIYLFLTVSAKSELFSMTQPTHLIRSFRHIVYCVTIIVHSKYKYHMLLLYLCVFDVFAVMCNF